MFPSVRITRWRDTEDNALAAVPLKLINPTPLQRFDCSACGNCCRGKFAITISAADRDRIYDQKWSDDAVGLGGKPFFTGHGSNLQLAHKPDGSCVFLDDNNRCKIHAKFGEPAKPIGCRMYPFRLIPVGNEVRVDVRLDCPSSAGNIGRPIPSHRDALLKLLKAESQNTAPEQIPPPLFGKTVLTWQQLYKITESLLEVLSDVSMDITRRVTACINFATLIRERRIIELDAPDFADFLETVVASVQETALSDDLVRIAPQKLESSAFRQVLGVYGKQDRVAGSSSMIVNLKTSLRMVNGKGLIPALREEFATVSFQEVEKSFGIPGGEAALAVERYLLVHLSGMGFFGRAFYGRSYLDGLNSLLLTFPLILWFARAYATAEGIEVLNASQIHRAMMIVDHQHGISPLLNMPGDKHRADFLCERDTLRTLAIWYGS